MAIVAELSYEDIAKGTFPDTFYAKCWQQATEQMHAAPSGDRLTTALALVHANAVTLNEER